jgi:anti-anti-sigma factor
MTPLLDFETDALPDALVARPLGDIDMAVTPELETTLYAAVREQESGCLVVDLGAVDYVDSSGIELLFRLHAALEVVGVGLIVVAPPGSNAARLLGLVAMDDIGQVRPSLADALDRYGSRKLR